MVDNYMLNKVLDKVFGDTKILIVTDDQLPDGIALKKCRDINDVLYTK